ncbi:MAG: 3-oxoacyl-ACP synthase [Bacteroidetes bacterium]|nr:3-oxoacyl-ACP synthase [Bacteroidota bacterium]
MKKNLKEQLHSLCLAAVEQRIQNAQAAIAVAQESANDDTKSSAGDKHETGRAMAQLEQEKSAHQLNEALELKKILEKINPDFKADSVQLGSVVLTDKGHFFIAIPVGKLVLDSVTYFAISITSPIGSKIKNLRPGDSFEMNGMHYKIKSIL